MGSPFFDDPKSTTDPDTKVEKIHFTSPCGATKRCGIAIDKGFTIELTHFQSKSTITITPSVSAAPEVSTFALCGAGLLAVIGNRWLKRKKSKKGQ